MTRADQRAAVAAIASGPRALRLAFHARVEQEMQCRNAARTVGYPYRPLTFDDLYRFAASVAAKTGGAR